MTPDEDDEQGFLSDEMIRAMLSERYRVLPRRRHPHDTPEAQAARRAALERATRTDRRASTRAAG